MHALHPPRDARGSPDVRPQMRRTAWLAGAPAPAMVAMRMAEVDELGKLLGRGSYGVVSARELRDAKADLSVVSRLVANGTWTRLWSGMYLTAAHDAGPLVRATAALKH